MPGTLSLALAIPSCSEIARSTAYPELAPIAQSAYADLNSEHEVSYRA
jgi:hypothetical protein